MKKDGRRKTADRRKKTSIHMLDERKEIPELMPEIINGRDSKSAGEKLHEKILEIQEANQDLTYGEAFRAAHKEAPDLIKNYADELFESAMKAKQIHLEDEREIILKEKIDFPEQERIYAACVKFRNLLFRLLDEERLPVAIHISVFKKGGDEKISD